MTTIHELKEAILEMEKVAHEWEQQADEAWAQADADFCEKIAGMYRIAAACCWEKLESLEAGDGWFRPEKGELPSAGRSVIAIVSGSPAKNITLNGSYQTATYYGEDSAGWAVDEWPEWEILQCIAGSRHRKPRRKSRRKSRRSGIRSQPGSRYDRPSVRRPL